MRHCFVFLDPDEAQNDGHLLAPKEEDEDDGEDDDHYDHDYKDVAFGEAHIL
jgi:hypothetical protein